MLMTTTTVVRVVEEGRPLLLLQKQKCNHCTFATKVLNTKYLQPCPQPSKFEMQQQVAPETANHVCVQLDETSTTYSVMHQLYKQCRHL